MERLNFSWQLDNKITGHGAPMSDNDLWYLRSKGIRAVVRMAEKSKARVITKQVKGFGFSDKQNLIAKPGIKVYPSEDKKVVRISFIIQPAPCPLKFPLQEISITSPKL